MPSNTAPRNYPADYPAQPQQPVVAVVSEENKFCHECQQLCGIYTPCSAYQWTSESAYKPNDFAKRSLFCLKFGEHFNIEPADPRKDPFPTEWTAYHCPHCLTQVGSWVKELATGMSQLEVDPSRVNPATCGAHKCRQCGGSF